MKQKSKFYLLFLLFLTAGISAQQAVTSGGGDGAGSGGTVNYSVGQVAFTSMVGSTGSVNQGVQQAYEISTVGVTVNQSISLQVTAFPNPVLSVLKLRIDEQDLQKFRFQLFDIAGKLVMEQPVSDTETMIQMENLANATYYLKVLNSTEEIKVFQIIKHN